MRFQTEPAVEYAGKAYRADGTSALAYVVKGWELGRTLDGEDVERTGFLVITALGDDYAMLCYPEDLAELPEDGFCRGCGATGCGEHFEYVERTVLDSALATGEAREHHRYSEVQPVGMRTDGTTLYRYRGRCGCGWAGDWHAADLNPDPVMEAISDGEQHAYAGA